MAVRPSFPNGFSPSRYARPDLRDPGLARNVARNHQFRSACEAVGVVPTVRQARKFLSRRGRWQYRQSFQLAS